MRFLRNACGLPCYGRPIPTHVFVLCVVVCVYVYVCMYVCMCVCMCMPGTITERHMLQLSVGAPDGGPREGRPGDAPRPYSTEQLIIDAGVVTPPSPTQSVVCSPLYVWLHA